MVGAAGKGAGRGGRATDWLTTSELQEVLGRMGRAVDKGGTGVRVVRHTRVGRWRLASQAPPLPLRAAEPAARPRRTTCGRREI
jgi:hypothetical protein